MTVAERRQALLEWFYAEEERSGMGTTEIALQATLLPTSNVTTYRAWLYPPEVARDRAFRDLKALEHDGHITRGQTHGKATWWYA